MDLNGVRLRLHAPSAFLLRGLPSLIVSVRLFLAICGSPSVDSSFRSIWIFLSCLLSVLLLFYWVGHVAEFVVIERRLQLGRRCASAPLQDLLCAWPEYGKQQLRSFTKEHPPFAIATNESCQTTAHLYHRPVRQWPWVVFEGLSYFFNAGLWLLAFWCAQERHEREVKLLLWPTLGLTTLVQVGFLCLTWALAKMIQPSVDLVMWTDGWLVVQGYRLMRLRPTGLAASAMMMMPPPLPSSATLLRHSSSGAGSQMRLWRQVFLPEPCCDERSTSPLSPQSLLSDMSVVPAVGAAPAAKGQDRAPALMLLRFHFIILPAEYAESDTLALRRQLDDTSIFCEYTRTLPIPFEFAEQVEQRIADFYSSSRILSDDPHESERTLPTRTTLDDERKETSSSVEAAASQHQQRQRLVPSPSMCLSLAERDAVCVNGTHVLLMQKGQDAAGVRLLPYLVEQSSS